jgi:hypothetical protein
MRGITRRSGSMIIALLLLGEVNLEGSYHGFIVTHIARDSGPEQAATGSRDETDGVRTQKFWRRPDRDVAMANTPDSAWRRRRYRKGR